MRITFCGAAETVTGSQHLIEVNGHRLLLDCGLYQGPRAEAARRNTHFHYDPHQIDAVILSHAHQDHAGNLPTLTAAGFRGPIYCTPATADVAALMLRDSARIQEEDTDFLDRRKREPGEPPIRPLYGMADAERTIGLLETRPYFKSFEALPGQTARFWDAGHVLGSAITELHLDEPAAGKARKLVFTGDLGRRGTPILREPDAVRGIDLLICESTYGNRVHGTNADTNERLAAVLTRVMQRRGKVVIPAFSFGRTQNIVYAMNQLFQAGRLPRLPIYVDSPLSTGITDVYRKHVECFDAEAASLLQSDRDLFGFFGLTYITLAQESRKLNKLDGPFVVIAASGMCEGGRVLHHLRHTVEDATNLILIVGYQASGTLGRRIVERQPRLRILDDWFDLRAEVEIFNELSAHADRNDFESWFHETGGGIDRAFLVHGEPPAMRALAPLLQPFVRNPVQTPALYETVEI